MRLGALLVASVLPLAVLSSGFAWVAGNTAHEAALRARYETARMFASTAETAVEGFSRALTTALALEVLASDEDSCLAAARRLFAILPALTRLEVGVGDRLVCGAGRSSGAPDAAIAPIPLAGRNPASPPAQTFTVVAGANGAPELQIVERSPSADGPFLVARTDLDSVWQRLESADNFEGSTVYLLTAADGVVAAPSGAADPASITSVIAAINAAAGTELPIAAIDTGSSTVSIARVGSTALRLAVLGDPAGVPKWPGTWVLVTIVVPLLFLFAAVAVAWIGVDRVVSRWVRRLRRTAALYGTGEMTARVGPIDNAPNEIRALAGTFDAMATNIQTRSEQLERALAEREHFLRELHHRIKNNFQMIASLLSLQRREVDPAAGPAIREAHDRVQALATAYRVSYADAESGAVVVGPLVRELVDRLRESAGARMRQLALSDRAGPATLELDRAVPFALLLTELLPPALDRASALDSVLRVALSRDAANGLVLEISLPDGARLPERALPSRLIRAYAAQLSAKVETADGTIRITLPPEQTTA